MIGLTGKFKKRIGELESAVQLLTKERDDLAKEVDRSPYRSLVNAAFGPCSEDELVSAFSVSMDDPLLVGVMHVLRAREIELTDSAGIPELSAVESKAFAVSSGAVRQVRGELVELVDWSARKKANIEES